MSEFKSVNPLPRSVTEMNEAIATVREFRATTPMRVVLELLALLDAETLEGLRSIEPERLQHEQGRLAAFGQLRDLLKTPT